jgi:hypothetical protein
MIKRNAIAALSLSFSARVEAEALGARVQATSLSARLQ